MLAFQYPYPWKVLASTSEFSLLQLKPAHSHFTNSSQAEQAVPFHPAIVHKYVQRMDPLSPHFLKLKNVDLLHLSSQVVFPPFQQLFSSLYTILNWYTAFLDFGTQML